MSSPSPVRKRRVFYIPGYDPIHPRRYRELYRKEGAEQARISGYDITLSPKATDKGKGRYGWNVQGQIDGETTQTTFDVLVWSDIVRDSMEQGILGTYAQLIRTAWAYIACGALFRLMRLRKGPVIAALYPVGMLILQLILALLAGHIVGKILAWATQFLPLGQESTSFAAHQMAASIAYWLGLLPTAWGLLHWFKAKDNKLFAYYLMHDYAYSARHKGANPPELEARMADFTDEIAEALTENLDEVLVVGHSSGAHLGVSILSDLIRQNRVPANGPTLSFLSLGQVVPMVSFLPKAHRLRADLHYLSTRDELSWVDVTAPGDGCAFALCDPVAVSGVAPEGQKSPLVLSAAFTHTLSPDRWKALRWRFFRLHFQYLCAFDRPGDYDYFQITAGPQTLGARFEGRPPSPSIITLPANKFTGMAA
ncbi:hypothetical protein [Roseovarius sp. MMSF_3281]|uniref:hypothetical protein n=1 Tax=Roseovarius sp. MMSF_3281 TaxID=3046694 RepID=UPI00273D8D26|nr:hypothetical protein [Roseovarius sp. MMSF_3281]